MTAQQLLEDLKNGAMIKKTSYTKFKRNKIVRGSFYDYTCDGRKITEKQFENIYYRLKKDTTHSSFSVSAYVFNI